MGPSSMGKGLDDREWGKFSSSLGSASDDEEEVNAGEGKQGREDDEKEGIEEWPVRGCRGGDDDVQWRRKGEEER